MASTKFLSESEQDRIVKAIESAELNTSGEIRVHLESTCNVDPVSRAIYLFGKLGMHKTRERNGVLIYIAWKSKKFAIIGDSGINSKVPDNFWEEEKELLLGFLKENRVADGLTQVITLAGDKLKEFFPYKQDDINEQSNEISFGE